PNPTSSSARLCITKTGTLIRGSLPHVSYLMLARRRTGNQGNNSAPISGMQVKVFSRIKPLRVSRSASSVATAPPSDSPNAMICSPRNPRCEEGTYRDAEAAYHWLQQRGFRGEQIIAFG